VVDDPAKDARAWGHRIDSVMLDLPRAFESAETVRRRMARERTWAMAAERLLGAARPASSGS